MSRKAGSPPLGVGLVKFLVSKARNIEQVNWYSECFRNPVNSPVEVGSLTPLFTGFFVYIPGGWEWCERLFYLDVIPHLITGEDIPSQKLTYSTWNTRVWLEDGFMEPLNHGFLLWEQEWDIVKQQTLTRLFVVRVWFLDVSMMSGCQVPFFSNSGFW